MVASSPTRRLLWTAGPLSAGVRSLPPEADHYLRRVLRLQPGDQVQLFDGQGAVAVGTLRADTIAIDAPGTAMERGPHLTVACAVPKGERADWLVEKLTELGVARLQWVIAERSVALPKGNQRLLRWQRLAAAAARQAQRLRLPSLAAPLPLAQFLEASAPLEARRWVAQPGAAAPLRQEGAEQSAHILLIGPEGGWTEQELRQQEAAGYTPAGLSDYVLRVETAAIAGASLLMAPARESE